MSTPTSVSIDIYVNEGVNEKQTKVFANNKAQVPVTVYVNVVGSGIVKEFGLLERQRANDLYIPPKDLGYTLPPNMTASPVESINERQYEAYPDLSDIAPPTDPSSHQKTFLVTCNDPSLKYPDNKLYELMGYVCIENYETSAGDIDTIFLYTDMDAKDGAGQPFFQQDFIQVETIGKLEIGVQKKETNNLEQNSSFDGGAVYVFKAYYNGTNTFTFESKECKISVDGEHYIPGEYIIADPNTIIEFGYDGTIAGINKLARAFVHQSASGKITQDLHDDSMSYTYSQEQGIASASCFFLKDSSIMNDNADDDSFSSTVCLDVEDVYGGNAQVRFSADLDASDGGYAKINDPTITNL